MKTILIYVSALFITSAPIFHHVKKTENEDRRDVMITYKSDFSTESKGEYWLLDSSITYKYVDSEWLTYTKNTILHRDDEKNILASITGFYNTDTESWINKDTCIITYFSNNSINTYLSIPWNIQSCTWEDTVLYENYDENGNKLFYFSKRRDYDNNVILDGYKILYKYDQSNTLLNDTTFIWDSTENSWENFACSDYTFSSGKLSESEIHHFDKDNTVWVKSSEKVYTYDGNGFKNNVLYRYWNTDTEEWIDYFNYTYNFDHNGLIQNEEWPTNHRYEYTFSPTEDIILMKTWNTVESDWRNSKKITVSYDVNGNKIQKLIQFWDNTNLEWKDDEKENFFWTHHETVFVKDIESLDHIKLYPNPTKGIIKIRSENSMINHIRIHDLSGKLVTERHHPEELNEIDLSFAESGIYIIHLYSDTQHFVSKLIKE